MDACRFCLEGGSTRENPLIQPCLCAGTGASIHWRCLRQWAIADPVRNGQACPVCKAQYNVQVVPRLETPQPPKSAALTIVENIWPIAGVIQLLAFLTLQQRYSYMSLEHNIYGALCLSHAIIQPTFILAFWNLWNVRNPVLYWRISRTAVQPVLLLCHAFLYYNLVMRQDIIFGSSLIVVMNCHWKEHQRILRTINRALLTD